MSEGMLVTECGVRAQVGPSQGPDTALAFYMGRLLVGCG